MASQVFHEISKHDIQAAISKAVELRAIHAALLQGTSPADLRLPSCASPSVAPRTCATNHFSSLDYPVFTPSYEEEPSPGYHHNHRRYSENRRLSGIWDISAAEREEESETDLPNSSYNTISLSLRRALPLVPDGGDPVEASRTQEEDPSKFLRENSCLNHQHSVMVPTSPEILRSELKPVTTCNACRPATISRDNERSNNRNDTRLYNETVAKDSSSFVGAPGHPPKSSTSTSTSTSTSKGPMFSWLFPRGLTKKKPKAFMSNCEQASPNCTGQGCEDATSHVSKDWGVLNLEALKKELLEANENRDAALAEVSQMRSSLGELQQRMASLEKYCDELKKALRQSANGGGRQSGELNQEAMVEGFLQMVSEARLSVKQFCKKLVGQIEESDEGLIEKLNLLLQPHNLTLKSKYSKGVLYHMEALVNQCLHHDFENCVFQRNGSAKILDPQQHRKASFSAFVALRNLSWNEVLGKGTKYYSEEFSRFCDQKMSCIISTLNWSRPWPEQLLQSFFVAAKCVWLLHLLAFSFHPPVSILRVDENRNFDPLYMEDVLLLERQRSRSPARVKMMIMPGFYLEDKVVLRCKVLCRYKTVA